VPTDPYISTPLDELPRQGPNLAPGVYMPPSASWRADRPGDLGPSQPEGDLLGSPGPNVGYALTLVNRVGDRLRLEPDERPADARTVVAALAMKRAAYVGRAPVIGDIEVAMRLLGFDQSATAEVQAWRPAAIRGAAHEYVVSRAIVDAVDVTTLCLPSSELEARLTEVRGDIARAAASAHDSE
jgi:hypothetical protein